MTRYIIALLLLTGCSTGGVDEHCNPNGTCNSENLSCINNGSSAVCKPKMAPSPPARCRGEADCFCLTCSENCGGRFQTCAFSDTSVWGSKPAICECGEKKP